MRPQPERASPADVRAFHRGLSLKLRRHSADEKTVEYAPPSSTRYAARAPGVKYLLGTTVEAIPPPAGKHVMIVDDDSNFRSLFKLMLAQSGFPLASIREAEESASAVAICQEGPIDIVFCDLNLSRLWPQNGIGTVYDIRRIRPLLPVYMVTADNTADVIEKVIQAGATGHILKPLNLRILKRVLAATFPLSSAQI
jgi:CheY-like chemotaxis protein